MDINPYRFDDFYSDKRTEMSDLDFVHFNGFQSTMHQFYIHPQENFSSHFGFGQEYQQNVWTLNVFF